MAGDVAGNLATFAVPGGAAAQIGRRAAAMLPQTLARAAAIKASARLAPEVGAMAGMEALKAPTADRTRGDAALEGALGATAGAGVGKVLTRTLRGVEPSAAGRELLARGVRATPGMVARNDAVPWVEQRMASLPLVGGRVRQMQERAVGDVNDLLAAQGAKPMRMPKRDRLERTLSGMAAVGGTVYHPGTAVALMAARYGVPTEVMRKLLTGHYKGQPAALARMLRRYGVTPATAGAAIGESDD
jgi:hypothetical protein